MEFTGANAFWKNGSLKTSKIDLKELSLVARLFVNVGIKPNIINAS
jgi:hypothetical protein